MNLKKERRELFIRWYAWSLTFKDCDPAIWMTNYLNDRYEHNVEQRYWFAWLYGNTYQLQTSWVMLNEFPDYELATYERIHWWHTLKYKTLRYQSDTKFEKPRLGVKFQSYRKNLGDKTQEDFFSQFLCDNENQSFDSIWKYILNNFYSFGRYTTWFYLQHLKHTCGYEIEPTSLMLNDYDGSKSHRNGLLLALGMDDDYNRQLSQEQYKYLESEAASIQDEMKARFPSLISDIDLFSAETCYCSFKKLFRKNNGRYLGYYLDRQSHEISQIQNDGWVGIDWDVLWQARKEILDKRLALPSKIDIKKYPEFLETGQLSRMDWMFDIKQTKVGLENFI